MKTLAITLLVFTVNISFSQKEKTVTVKNEVGELEGTLLYPKKKNIPVALIIAGSGPTDRNGNQGFSLQSNTYKLLAEGLAEKGIASLRYDKQGVGGSENAMLSEEETIFHSMVNDAGLFIDYLKKQKRFNEIIVIGHSEGALVGKLLAQEKEVDKLISVAGAGRPISEILVEQINAQDSSLAIETKRITDAILAGDSISEVPQQLQGLFRESIIPYLSSWLPIDPLVELKKAKIPCLVVQGERDIQVKVEDAKILSEAENAELVLFEKMNHVLKDAPEDRQGNMMTYIDKKKPLTEGLIQHIADFILN